MNRAKQTPRSHGVALVMALALLGIVAVVLGAVAVRTNVELKRTMAAGEEAQASQLLIAGAAAAREQHAAAKTTDGPISTPVGEITLSWRGDVCVIDARLPRLTRSIEIDLKP